MKKLVKGVLVAVCAVSLVLIGCSDPAASEVSDVAVTGVTLDQSSHILVGGHSFTLNATVLPANATNKNVTWSSNNESFVRVEDGEVTAVAEGTATVTVTTADGNKTAACIITVYPALPDGSIYVSGVSFEEPTIFLSTDETPTAELIATVTPEDATDKTLIWESSNTKVATVDKSGKVTAVGSGTTTITATAVYGTTDNIKATCTVKVTSPLSEITAWDIVAGMKIGWNLGNSLDADGGETAWGNPKTTQANITAIKNAGFNVIRIPVSWHNGTDVSYTISSSWMNRVKEVVDYAVAEEMYIILNTHHDENIFKFENSNAAAGQAAFKKIWEQIAATFKDYDEKLIFEGLNEPRTKGSSNEWGGGTAAERANLNKYYEIFLKAVRESGGNNSDRILMINPYAASGSSTAMNGLVLPADSAKDKLIVSFHNYAPNPFALNTSGSITANWSDTNIADTSPITDPIDSYYSKFVSKGIPVVIGEFGAMNRDNQAARKAWAAFYVSKAWEKGMRCVWWDNGVTTGTGEKFGLLNRNNNTIIYTDLLEGLMAGTGEPGYMPPIVTPPGDVVLSVKLNPNVYDADDGKGEAAHGYQAKFPISDLLAGVQITSGNIFTLTYTVTSDVAIGQLQVVLVDTRASADTPYWTELSGYANIGAVNTSPVSGTKTITATKTAGDSSGEANQFVLTIGEADSTPSAPTLTFTVLTLVKNP